MASPQVLPNSSRENHLEAGKKKLEEFRRQRKAKTGRKTESSTQNQSNQLTITETNTKHDSSENTTIYPNGPALNNTETTTTTIHQNLIPHISSNGLLEKLGEQQSSTFISNISNGYHNDWRENKDTNSIQNSEPLFSTPNFGLSSMNQPVHEASSSNYFLTRNPPEVSPSQLEGSSSQFGLVHHDSSSLMNPYSNLGFDSNQSNTLSTEFRNPSRSRRSFLESIGVTPASSSSHERHEEPENSTSLFAPNNSNSNYSNVQDLNYQNVPTREKDNDFTALEQLIEDLTVEKFSLQRALDASKSIADTLTSDNASLTEDYNKQGQVISQLRYDMETFQGEINAQSLALDSLRMEYENAQLECRAADERAKLLASDLITSEERALRLRSNELKLEKQVESLHSEISSFKRKLSALERERQDFQSTIDALQEEKKLLQSKIRNTSTIAPEIRRTNASTSTNDLSEIRVVEESGVVNNTRDIPSGSQPLNNTSEILFSLEEMNNSVPSDQLRIIDNINSLVSELSVEREELTKALRIESSNCSKLKDLNKDLTQKLEAQTQRLELIVSERMMANETSSLSNPSDSLNLIAETSVYADEGDEVVERVLGWIIKLFPGGPAKRRTSKLL